VSYAKLLDVFWHNCRPDAEGWQFCDHGNQYRTAIFYHDEEQKQLAEAAKAKLQQDTAIPG
jgi:peptide-methionine (S)-S-oxide reductase